MRPALRYATHAGASGRRVVPVARFHACDTSTFAALKTTFFKRWPPPKPPKLSRAQQRECVSAHALKEENSNLFATDWLDPSPSPPDPRTSSSVVWYSG